MLDCTASPSYLETVIVIASDLADLVPAAWRTTKRVERFEDVYCDRSPTPVEIHPSDPASIMYTSATTGPSKGVIWSHKSTLHLAETWATKLALDASDIV
jgi:crotonobetaine/carnitine-CoA ligase